MEGGSSLVLEVAAFNSMSVDVDFYFAGREGGYCVCTFGSQSIQLMLMQEGAVI
jgi:hypothetical protein